MSLSLPIPESIWQHKQYNNFRIKVTIVTEAGEVHSYCLQSGALITPININDFYKYWSEDLLPYSIYNTSGHELVAPTPLNGEENVTVNQVPSLKRKRV